MNAPTIIVKTPVSDIEVEIRQWITGRQAEYIQDPFLSAVKMDGSSMVGNDPKINIVDAKTAIQESAHREIECYIARVGTETDPKIYTETILDMPESDYLFVQEEIKKTKEGGKKKSEV